MRLDHFLASQLALAEPLYFSLYQGGIEVWRRAASVVAADGRINYHATIEDAVCLSGFDEIAVSDGDSVVRRKKIPADLKLVGDSVTLRWTVTLLSNDKEPA